MERICLYLFFHLSMAMCCLCGKSINMAHAAESPQYTVISSESDFEIRLYKESSWMSSLVVGGTSFEEATKNGFHRLYQYLHGANMNSSKLEITAPVLTRIAPSSQGNNYTVRLYVPNKYQDKPPQPNPELKLQLAKWGTRCIAVRKFTGFAKDDNINKETEALVSSLKKQLPGNSTTIVKNFYTIAQYNSSSERMGRLNEVWIKVLGLAAEGCPPSQ
ncbi:hypothetical protein L6164_020570 [Bauhinia variegata]|uniref:Uncharacterized protein n=1 Tax=Bauhinia variegata TaxID=167791 RepID=A0ACB9MXJ9_BAUVA|nr:hypothetical protein L6164_020570 [Bauhinia variegata]